MSALAVGFADIEAAARTLAGQVVRTPCLRSERLSELLGCDITLKFETFQHSSSFKDRGAYVKLASLGEEERARGVIAMSAGNHAQGVAYHATRLGIPATIVMPKLTPFVKVEKTTQFGARVLLEGDSVDEAAEFAHRLAAERNLTFIHPYDDPLIIAGQGTIGLEMLSDAPDLEALIVPIGGGGLISGVAIAAKAKKPEIEIVGVQAAACPSMYRRRAGLPEAPLRPTIAEGIAVKTPGELTLPIVRELVGDILLVEEDAIEDAILALLEVEKVVVEGAGAVGLAALMAYRERFVGRRVGLVLCGGNIDLRLLSVVILRGLVHSKRVISIRVGMPDAPGNLARAAALIGEAGGNILEVAHQRAFSPLSIKSTEVNFIIETQNAAHATEVVTALRAAGFEVRLREAADPDGF
ncbi:MAG TPA: threonine ammonia-lyase [Geminicoccaceae bacterium]|nr:threonine ammonia-lyase [Geminicoccaceae bacterium]